VTPRCGTVFPGWYHGHVIAVDIPFWATFWPALVAGLVATAVGGFAVLGVGYVLIDRRLHLRDRADRDARENERRRGLRDANLRIAHGELKSIAKDIEKYGRAIANDDVPYPPFDRSGWQLVSQADVLATLKPETAEAVTIAYNRVLSTNGQIEEFADLTLGPTAALLHSSLATAADEEGNLLPLADTAYGQYQKRRADLRTALAARFVDLRRHIDIAVDAIEAELGIEECVPSAQRRYIGSPIISDLTKSPADDGG